MGFPSPAMDYQEQRMTIDAICGVDNNCRVIETSCGWAVINVSLKPEGGDTLLVSMDGRNQFVKLMGHALITQDGEAIEGMRWMPLRFLSANAQSQPGLER
jgi:DNA polymerase V